MDIVTAAGKTNASDMGMFNSHMHLIAMPPPWLYKTPTFSNDADYALTDESNAIAELETYMGSGGESAFDATCRDYGRNPEAIERILGRSDVKLILATGFNRGIYLDSYYHEKSAEELSELWAREIEESIEGTSLRAGVIKVGMDYMHIMPVEEKCIMAALEAHKRTRAPISVHTTMGTMASEFLDLAEKNGVDAGAVIFFHADRNPDAFYWKGIAERGSFITIDQIGKINYGTESSRARFIEDLINAGFEDRILLGTDFARRSNFRSYGYGPGLGYLFGRFVPFLTSFLAADGIEKEKVLKAVNENPREAFSLK
jgi:phosphotriesterase-related protein